MESQIGEPKKWKSWQVVLILLFTPFILLYLATKFIWKRNWSIPIKLGAISFLWGIFFIAVISNASSNKTEVQSATDTAVIKPTTQPTDIPVPTATPEPATIYTPTPTPTYYPQKVYSLPTEIPTQKPIYIAPTNPPAQYFAPPVNQPAQNNSSSYSSGGSVSSGGDKDCPDFATHGEAQNYFVSRGGSPSNNVDRLDADHDGIACENLP